MGSLPRNGVCFRQHPDSRHERFYAVAVVCCELASAYPERVASAEPAPLTIWRGVHALRSPVMTSRLSDFIRMCCSWNSRITARLGARDDLASEPCTERWRWPLFAINNFR